ncbi:50S ribosomal protein L6 [Carboxylicivirga sp. M1479]|uniref:50S ribosomal protein L6 n=1 Tax=Carboxylicivirga sp. M1479 TaxID=2594476 RepID=UPI0011787FE8|nr:50S ribosomal protein L6 [Carboxylicivirga sp. M1479]TRX65739.1 50S ribosomal protein L6 [Carboxylicivirga sp. M1479]
MSRIGKAPISIPSGVNVTVKDNTVTVKGPKGELTQDFHPEMEIKVEEGTITVVRPNEEKETRAQHGLYRSLINNMVIGVSEGYVKELELVGVGYRATNQGQLLELALGFSHPIQLLLPAEIKVEAVTDRKSNPIIKLESADKQLIGQVCAKIRSMRKPEPYKGKGVRFKGEEIRRKAGKSAKV